MPHSTLITPAELAEHLGDPRWVIFDCRHQLHDKAYGPRVYATAHIPGARFADVDADLSAPIRPDTGRHPLPETPDFVQWLGAQGVGPGAQVVVYDDKQGGFAARLWWMLKYLGHESVALLDGGFARWLAEARPTDMQVPRPARAEFLARPNPRMLAPLAEVEALSAGRLGTLIDARAAERYRGEVEPIDPKPGHIPGAINLPFTDNLNPDGTFLPSSVLQARFAPLLGTDAAARVHYCGSGVTACHNILAMAVAGLPPGRLFAGSWSLWSKDPTRPVATGPQRG